jgi:hypothetical protein
MRGQRRKGDPVDMTGWVTGHVFLQTVDESEAHRASAFLAARGVAYDVLTVSDRIVVDPTDPDDGVYSGRFSVAAQLGGFPQTLAPLLTELLQRARDGDWTFDQSLPLPS